MPMTPEQAAAEKTRKLRALRAAAQSALVNGASVDEARAEFEAGLAEVLDSPHLSRIAEQARADAAGTALSPPEAPAPAMNVEPTERTPAMMALLRAAGMEPKHRAA